MGRLLDALRNGSEAAPIATPATLATVPTGTPKVSQSRNCRKGAASAPAPFRARLLEIAADEILPLALPLKLSDADVIATDGLHTRTLRAYLHALARHERMDKGLPPLDWGTVVERTCRGCGPVLLWAGCPDMVTACPWCFRRKAGKRIARPTKPHPANSPPFSGLVKPG